MSYNFEGSETLSIDADQRVHVSVNNLTVTTLSGDSEEGGTTILDEVSFELPQNNMMAIMGGSGAGKTTLLNVLAQRTNINSSGLSFGGSVTYLLPTPTDKVKLTTAYMLQEDTFLPGLTLEETLHFQAELRLTGSTKAERTQFVSSLLTLLELDHRKDEIVKSFTGAINLSGGEQRRTSLAIQLLNRPQLLFLDEPTTGLDTSSALTMISVLHKLSSPSIGITIILLIHQPRREVLDLFDKLCVLTRGGKLVYYGSLSDSAPYFAQLQAKGFVTAMDACADPYSFLTRIMVMLVKDTASEESEKQTQILVASLVQEWRKSNRQDMVIDQEHQKDHFLHNLKVFKPKNPLPFHRELSVLVRRTLLLSYRDRMSLIGLHGGSMILGIFTGWLFYKPTPDLAGIRSITSALYAVLEVIGFAPLAMELQRLWEHDGVFFFKEYREQCVTIPGFVVSRRLAKLMIEDLPLTLIYATTTYFMAGLRLGDSYSDSGNGSYFGIYFTVALLVETIGMLTAMLCFALSSDFSISVVIMNGFYQLQNSGCGYFVNAKTMPVYVRWVKYIAYFWYAFGALTSNQYSNWMGKCPSASGDASCDEYSGNWQLLVLGYPVSWIGAPLGYLVAWLVGYNLIAIVALRFKKYDVVFAKQKTNKIGEGEETVVSGLLLNSSQSSCEKGGNCVSVGLTVKNISLSVKVRESQNLFKRKVPRLLLNDVTANFQANAVNVIMGPSGSGKSTLLNTLASRLPSDYSFARTGSLFLNKHQEVTPAEISRISAYVTQHDNLLIPSLTVRETLYYQARLRLPVSEHARIPAYISQILRQTGLVDCADTPIGTAAVKGISGGEKRRVSIAIQLLDRPAILFLDEPTSGLDTATSGSIVRLLQLLASSGTTIVATIHQPSQGMFSEFDSLVLLARGGYVVYDGPAKKVKEYTSSIGYECPESANEADFLLDLVSMQLGESREQATQRKDYLIEKWTKSAPRFEDVDLCADNVSLKDLERASVPWWNAFRTVCSRQYIVSIRSVDVFISRVVMLIVLAIIFALFFAPLKNSQEGISNRLGLTQSVLNLYFCGLINNLALYPSQRDLFHQEYLDRAYGVLIFSSAYLLVELPFEILSSVVFAAIVVFAIGLPRTPEMYFSMLFCAFVSVNAGESAGIFFASLFKHMGLVTNLLTNLFIVAIFMAGTMSLHMPAFLKAWNYLNPTKYMVQICTTLGFKGQVFDCPEGICSLRTGEDVLEYYGLKADLTLAFGALVACLILNRIVATAAMQTRAKWFL